MVNKKRKKLVNTKNSINYTQVKRAPKKNLPWIIRHRNKKCLSRISQAKANHLMSSGGTAAHDDAVGIESHSVSSYTLHELSYGL